LGESQESAVIVADAPLLGSSLRVDDRHKLVNVEPHGLIRGQARAF
jgi:hypothetical protein